LTCKTFRRFNLKRNKGQEIRCRYFLVAWVLLGDLREIWISVGRGSQTISKN